MVDDLLDPMYEFEPYDDEAYEVQQFAKGGLPTPQRQWLKDAVENEVKRFQQTTAGGMDPQQALQQLQQSMQEADFQALPEGTRNAFQRSQEDLQRKAALNAWLGGTATKYIKRDYGTEQDPLTQLQMRHTEGEWPPRAAQGVLGRPPQVMGLYETTALRYTDPRAYGDSLRYNEEVLQSNPWLRNLPADQPIYRAVDVDALGMPHLVDEIQNAMNPSAGLPRNLQIRPESLQRMSFPQASELVGKINQYRAERHQGPCRAHSYLALHRRLAGYTQTAMQSCLAVLLLRLWPLLLSLLTAAGLAPAFLPKPARIDWATSAYLQGRDRGLPASDQAVHRTHWLRA